MFRKKILEVHSDHGWQLLLAKDYSKKMEASV